VLSCDTSENSEFSEKGWDDMPSVKEQQAITKAQWTQTTWEEISTFIGPNADKYRAYYDKSYASMVGEGKQRFFFSWHWPALIPLLGIPWGVARKNWEYVGTMAFIYVALAVISLFFQQTSFGFVVFMAPAMAKQVYMQSVMTKIAKIRQATPEGPAREAALLAAGGLDMKSGYIAGAICLAFVVFTTMMVMKDV
jgi:hypothetical protein